MGVEGAVGAEVAFAEGTVVLREQATAVAWVVMREVVATVVA